MSRSALALLAFASGTLVPIEAVPDPVFSERMLGDGIAIRPDQGLVTAPCAGTVIQVHRAGHAYGLQAPDGARVLLHVGLETVKLNGLGFCPKVAVGDRVEAGQSLVVFDLDALTRDRVDPLTMLVVENSDAHPVSWYGTGAVRAGRDRVLQLGDGAGAPLGPAGAERAEVQAWASGSARVRHEEGLHARPAALVARAARGFQSVVDVVHGGRRANARSVVALLGLAVEQDGQVEVHATGPDAAAARDAVVAALEGGLSTAAVRTDKLDPAPGSGDPLRPAVDGELSGVTASRGLALGRTFHHRPGAGEAELPEQGQGPDQERRALAQALDGAAAAIDAAILRAGQSGCGAEAAIFAAHRVLIDDPELLGRAQALIASGKGAAWAWNRTLGEQSGLLAASGNALIAERAADLRDIERQVVRLLTGAPVLPPRLPENTLLLAEALTPAELASLDWNCLAGIVTQGGGPMSHVAILARSHGIPALIGVGAGLRRVPEASLAVLDADGGTLCWKPGAPQVARARAGIAARRERAAQAQRFASAPALTADGVAIDVAANLARADEAAGLLGFGADGVGLLRTELLFMARQTAPSEDEQREAYQAVLDALDDGGDRNRCLIIRTLDVGADKPLAYLPMPREENPALGLRGIRLGLARPDLLRAQLRACLRLRPLSRVRLLLPMVTDLDDLLGSRRILDELAAELGLDACPQLGVMIETPAAALLADQLAATADFFSLGSNDLTQYTLAMDRTNSAVARRLDDCHPAVLRLIATAAEGAARHGRWVGLCGAMASDPLAVPLLLGLGVTELSVSPAQIAGIKQVVRRLELGACREAARQALALASAAEVRNHLRNVWPWLAEHD
jgi:phosphocarrier protein FPr/phosphocarrier protein